MRVRITDAHLEVLIDLAGRVSRDAAKAEAKNPGRASAVFEAAAWLHQLVTSTRDQWLSGEEPTIAVDEDTLQLLREFSPALNASKSEAPASPERPRGPDAITLHASPESVSLQNYSESVQESLRSAEERRRQTDPQARAARVQQFKVIKPARQGEE